MSSSRVVLTNSAALYALYGANFLLPLITVPYLLRVLGLAPFGAIAFAGSVLQVVAIFTAFTFNYTATPLVATSPDDRELQGSLLSTVGIARAVLFVAAVVVLAVATAFVGELRERWLLLLVQLPIAAAELFFPSWLFAGVQRMVLITLLNVVSRVATLGLLFVFVHSPDDAAWAAGIQASHFVISGVLAHIVLFRVLGVRYGAPYRGTKLRTFLHDSWRMFIATAAGHVYVRGSMVVLGFFTNDVVLGHFAVVQKIGGLLTGLVGPLTQAVLPHAAQVWASSRRAFFALQRKLVALLVVGFVVVLAVLNLLGPQVVEVLAGEPTPEVVALLRWFTPTILVTALSTVLTTLLLATQRYEGLQRIFLGGAIIFVVLAPPLTYFWEATGMAITLLAVESFMAIGCLRASAREPATVSTDR